MGRTAKNRSHSFAGCWTCRRRHVKCDESVPTCQRCRTAQVECLGYGFRFDIPDGVQSSRQRLPPDSRPDLHLRLSNNEIDEHLADVEVASRTTHRGPFSLLNFDEGSSDERPPPVDVKLVDWSVARRTSADSTHSSNSTSQSPSTAPTSLSISSVNDATSDLASSSEDSSERRQKRRRVTWIPSPADSPPLSFVPNHLRDDRLFHHYMTWVCKEYVVHDVSTEAADTAFSSVIPAVAVGGGVDTNAQAAVYHGLCAIAASNLATISPDPNQDRLEALRQEKLALRHLRISIDTNSDAYFALAVAILAIMLGEHVSGRAHEFELHAHPALRCLELAASRKNDHQVMALAVLEQWSRLCAMCKIVPQNDIRAIRRALSNGNTIGYSSRFCANLSFGLLEVINTLHELHLRPTRPHPGEIARLQRELATERPPDGVVKSIPDHIFALGYHATALYFARVAWQLPSQASHVHKLIERGLRCMEGLETNGRAINNVVIAWAVSLIGSECDLADHQRRFIAWCDKPAIHKVPEMSSICEVAMATWEMRKNVPEKDHLMWWHSCEEVSKGGEAPWQYSPADGPPESRVTDA